MEDAPIPFRSIVVGTAGHIDHGKTTLVRALTGIDADRLPEEKRRGITIDLGFAAMDTRTADGIPLRISFVDVPGHQHFIRNMLAGAGCIDAVLLVVSAEEGIKPQTIEHLDICTLLGVRRGITVITRIDSVSEERLEEIKSQVGAFLAGTFLGGAAATVIAVSAHTGQGIDQLRCELQALAHGPSLASADHLPRLPLDRAFVMKGFGTVVTGTLLSGSLDAGQSLALEPGGRIVRVRGMQNHGRAENQIQAGSRAALNLSGVEVAEVSRGQTLVEPDTLTAVSTIDAEVSILAGAPALKHHARVHFHAFTSDTLAIVSIYDYASADPGTRRLMRLKLDQPVLLLPHDRFVLRQCSPAMTIGGGRVVDAHPVAHLRRAKIRAWLDRLKDASQEEQLILRIGRTGVAGMSLRALVAETGLAQPTLLRLLESSIDDGELLRIPGDILLTGDALELAASNVMKILEKRSHGVKRSELRSQTGLSGTILDFLLPKLAGEHKLRLDDEFVHAAGARSQVADEDSQWLSAIAAEYESASLAAPSPAEVAARLKRTDVEMRRLMTLLLRDGIMVRLGVHEVYVHRIALEGLRGQVRALRGQTLDVTRFKQITGLSRKYAIPLLEYLDRERLTRKIGDQRVVL